MSTCRSCGGKANSMNFCPYCMTSIHVVSDKEYQLFQIEANSQKMNKKRSSAKKEKVYIVNKVFSKQQDNSQDMHGKTDLSTKCFYYLCRYCTDQFPTKALLIEHIREKHPESGLWYLGIEED